MVVVYCRYIKSLPAKKFVWCEMVADGISTYKERTNNMSERDQSAMKSRGMRHMHPLNYLEAQVERAANIMSEEAKSMKEWANAGAKFVPHAVSTVAEHMKRAARYNMEGGP